MSQQQLGLELTASNEHTSNFSRHYYEKTFLNLNEFRGAAPLSELQEIFPQGSGLVAEFEPGKIVLYVDDLLSCLLNEEVMTPFQEYPLILSSKTSKLTIGKRVFEISAFEC